MDLIFAWHQLLPGWRVFNPIRCAVLLLHYICLLIGDKPVNPPLITIADLMISNLREYREARISWHLLCVSIPEDENCCRCLSSLFECHSMAWQLQHRGCGVLLNNAWLIYSVVLVQYTAVVVHPSIPYVHYSMVPVQHRTLHLSTVKLSLIKFCVS